MKHSILKFKYVIVLFSLLTITGCTQQGDVGPIGPQGEQGAQGEPGQDGTDGQDGEDGNANLIVSDWIPNGHSSSQQSSFSQFEVEEERLTAEVLSSALVMAYVDTGGFGIYPLPDVAFNIVNTYSLSEGKITFQAYTVDNSDANFSFLGPFRYVVIASNTTTGKYLREAVLNDLKEEGVDINNYQQVADYFNLKD
ncbi:collagen-like protein [Aggregatimonas sangjinii]|uniref:Collagen-like protein n=1 Tax=Aggregatimonas sangjinii TaxID=2583587 RepID=A0A5B7SSQ6_9FLAO|nr:collagen-like protein [Aggregatimonas sangjinii]QCX01706.1 collagen-like protein [Aggregatimonas sangjinii]